MTDHKRITAEFTETAMPAISSLTLLAKPEFAEGLNKEQRAAQSKAAQAVFAAAHRKAEADIEAYRQERWAEAVALRRQDPPDPGRTERLIEADQLARTVTTRLEARNRLLPEGFAAIGRGDWRRAETYAMAARLAGSPSEALVNAIETVKDQDPAYTNRHRAVEIASAADAAWTEQTILAAQAKSQVEFLTGNGPASARASIGAKMAAYRLAQETGQDYRGHGGIESVTGLPEPKERLSSGGNRMVEPSSAPGGGTRFTAVPRTAPSRERPLKGAHG